MKRDAKTKAKAKATAKRAKTGTKARLLSGGNPQIAKADGDAPVRAYIANMPGWKSGVGKRLDALIDRAVPDVRKAVKWNSPFYGVEGQGWFLSFHTYTRYVKVAFFRGASLRPPDRFSSVKLRHAAPPGRTPRFERCSTWASFRPWACCSCP